MRSRARISSHPIHPILIAFPIGLLVTSFVFDLIGLWRDSPSLWMTGWYCIIAGLVSAALAAVPGVIDLFSVVPPNSSARKRGYTHAILNGLVIIAFVAEAAYRGRPDVRPDGTAIVLSVVAISLLGFSGWLGGTLVYRNQIGVDRRYANASQMREIELHDWNQPVCKADDLREGQLMLAEIQGTRVAIGRCPEGVVAFHDHCTHRGGPLSDGTLIGCTVQCPWHGSQFDVHSGRVIAGPAEERILTYEVVTRGDEIFVFPRREEQSDELKSEAA